MMPPAPPPPQRPHRTRNIVLGVFGFIAVLIIAGAVSAHQNNSSSPSASSGPQVTTEPIAADSPSASPTAPSAPEVILRMSGNSIQNSAPFKVTSGTLTVRYSYDCASYGSQGNFIADLETGNQNASDYDDQTIANALGMSGSDVTTIYPQDVGQDYHLAVDSECDWTVVVRTGG